MPDFSLPPRRTWIDHTSEVHTDERTLYALLSDIDGWPSWTPGLRAIERRKRGFAGPGARFTMVLDAPIVGRLILPTVMYRNEPRHIEWGGGALGSKIRHSMTLEPLGPERTRLRHLEYATGLLAMIALPAEGYAYGHDLRWSRTIEARFVKTR